VGMDATRDQQDPGRVEHPFCPKAEAPAVAGAS